MITTWGNKRVPQTFPPQLPLFEKIRFNQFIWLCTIGNYAFCNFVTSQKADFVNFFTNFKLQAVLCIASDFVAVISPQNWVRAR